MHCICIICMHVREAPQMMTHPTFGTFGRIIASHVGGFPYGVTFDLLCSFILYHWWSPLLWNLMHNSLLFRLVMFSRCSRQQDPRKSKGDDVFETFSTNPWPLFASSSSSLLSTKKDLSWMFSKFSLPWYKGFKPKVGKCLIDTIPAGGHF